MEEKTTNDLVRRSQEGDQSAFAQLFREHQGNVYGQALRMVRNEDKAKDIAQQAWIKAWNKIGTFRGDAAFSSWLYRIVTFTGLDQIRKTKSKRETTFDNEDTMDAIVSQDASETVLPEQLRNLERQELKEYFNQALETLPENLKSTLMLREIEGLTYEEIAQKLRCKTGTVMSRLFNARKAMQRRLKDLLS